MQYNAMGLINYHAMHYWDALPMVVYHALQCISRVHYYEIHCIVVCTTMQFQGALQCNWRRDFNCCHASSSHHHSTQPFLYVRVGIKFGCFVITTFNS